MSKAPILVVWSNYYETLAKKQLDSCLQCLENNGYSYLVETVEAGTYEIPAVIRYFQQNNPYDAYLPLGLLLKGSTDHYEFIWQHIKECFIQFTMQGITMGNGIISAYSMDDLVARVDDHERVEEAVRAIGYLLRLKK